jgi:D-alanine-D-alanine ligase
MQGLLCDKWKTRAVMASEGVNVPQGQLLRANNINQVTIPCPLIVKPAREDNSQGVSHVRTRDQLQAALDLAFKADDLVIVEEFIAGREIRVGIVTQSVLDNIDTPLTTQVDVMGDGLHVLP